jgi:ubiquinone/menaquinone biosynthesis C-methylase UbiE
MEDPDDVDLHIPDKLLDIHLLRDQRMYFEKYIESDVEYFARLHSINFVNFHVQLLSKYLRDSTIVDIGCGQLPYINFFSNFGIRAYYALDLEYESLTLGQRRFRGDFPLFLIQHSEKNVPFQDNSVDVVVSSEVIEHLEEPIAYLEEIRRICAIGGYLALSTPCVSMYYYPYNFFSFLKNPVNRSFWSVRRKYLNAHKYWGDALSWHPALRPKVLRHWLEDVGFKIIEHKSKLWFYHTPYRPAWRFFCFLERKGISAAGKMFNRYLSYMERILSLNLPIIKWAGIRQFVLCKKH